MKRNPMSAGRCIFPIGNEMECGAPTPARQGAGRPKEYCDDPAHTPLRAHRAKKAAAAADSLTERLRRAEAGRRAAEIDALAARRERDAALALRDLAQRELASARAEMADTVARIRAECDREVAQVAAVADAEIGKAIAAVERAARRTA